MDATQEKSFRVAESQLRQKMLRAFSALLVTAASLLLFLFLPLLPRELMVFVAIGLGALAYRVPTLALVLMVLLAVPGYAYQLSNTVPAGVHVPVAIVGVMGAALLVIAVLGGETGTTLGVAVGAIAAVLTLTPFQPLALPLILAIALLRVRHARLCALLGMLTFVILYYPMFAAASASLAQPAVPILERVSLHTGPTVSALSIDEISRTLRQVAGGTARETAAYVRLMTDYWPLSPEKRLLPAAFIFVLFASAGMAAGAAILWLFRWLRKREVVGTPFAYGAPVACMLGGTFAFVYLSILLAAPLDFKSASSPALMLIGGVLAGGCGSVVEVWLGKRDVTVDYRERLSERAAAVRADTDLLKSRTEETKGLCSRMDTSAEDALREMCEQELNFTEQSVADMSLLDLRAKTEVFDQLRQKLGEAVQESKAKLYKYHDEDWQTYNHSLVLAQGYGFSVGEAVEGPSFSVLTSMDYGDVTKLQAALNRRYEKSARSLAESIERLVARIRSEVDPDFKRAGLDIARDYLERGHYGEGLQEFLQELSEIEYFLARTISGLDDQIRFVQGKLKATVTGILVPTASNLGDQAGVQYYRELLGRIETLSDLPGEKPRLPDLMHVVSIVDEMGRLIADLASRLGDRIGNLELSVQNKTPRGYAWNIDRESLKRVGEISQALRRPNGTTGIQAHMSLLKTGPDIVDSAAHAVEDYSVANELLINYANIEYLVDERLEGDGEINARDLPVVHEYAVEYLELYRLRHPGQVQIDRDTSTLSNLSGFPQGVAKK